MIAPSECSLIIALQATSTHALDWRETARHNVDKVVTYADRIVQFADTEAGGRVHHVDYRRLVTEPVEVAREVRQGFGLPFDADHERRLAQYASENRQHKHGRHRYSLEGYELDPDKIDGRFAAYRERFAAWLP